MGGGLGTGWAVWVKGIFVVFFFVIIAFVCCDALGRFWANLETVHCLFHRGSEAITYLPFRLFEVITYLPIIVLKITNM